MKAVQDQIDNTTGEHSSSTERWKDVPRGTMDEVSSLVRLDLPFTLTARPPKRLFRLVLESHRWKGLRADSEEKREPVSDIDTAVVDSLKALDPNGRLEKRTLVGAGPAMGCRLLTDAVEKGFVSIGQCL